MKKEIETQVLGIDEFAIIEKLTSLGAVPYPEELMRRWMFLLKPHSADKGEWIRVRQSNSAATLTYKKKSDKSVTGTNELEVDVSNFNKTVKILNKLPCFCQKYYQENKRKRFILGDVEVSIDKWPTIPPFAEIEGPSEGKVREMLRLLSLEAKDSGHLGIFEIYRSYDINAEKITELKFEQKEG